MGQQQIPEYLEPRLEYLKEKYVLIQAWKKTANYIRNRNWYSDTLELDRITINLPEFIEELDIGSWVSRMGK